MQKLLLLLLFTCAANPTLFAQKTWTGASDTDWTKDDNWAPSGVPSSADEITIPADTPNSPVVPDGSVIDFLKITVDNGASLTIGEGAEMVADGSPDHTLVINGTFINHGTVSITNGGGGDEEWAAVEIGYPGIFDNYGTLNETGAH